MGTEISSPRISSLSWGRLVTDDGVAYKDAKLYPGGGREWDWCETGTHHVPGIQPADVEELLATDADVVVLSTGHWRNFKSAPPLLSCWRSGVSTFESPRPKKRWRSTTH